MNASSGGPRGAAIYCRVSSSGQEDNSSLGTQEAACRAYATENGFEIRSVFREIFSGTELFDRPELTRLRERIRHGEIDVVIAYALDRLSRDPVHVGVILSEADHHHVAVHFVTEPLDDSPEGQLIRFVRGYAAKVEHMKILERTTRGKKARAAAGKLLPGCKPLYGYEWVDATKSAYRVDPLTGPTVQRIFRELTQGKSLRRIAADLTRDGVATPTQRGTHWRASTIARMLHHHAYKGEAYAWNAQGKQMAVDRATAIRLPDGTIPPLVDPATWEAAHRILQRNKATAVRSAKRPEAALLRGGYARCGQCGLTMRVKHTPNGIPEYRCRRADESLESCIQPSIRAHVVDTAVWSIVTAIVQDPRVIQQQLERTRANDPTADDLAVIDRGIAEVQRQQAKLTQAIALLEDGGAMRPLVERLETAAARMRQLEDERAQLLRRRASWADTQASYAGIETWCHRVAQNLDALSFKDKQMLLDVLGLTVTIFGKDHDPRYVITADIDPDLVSHSTVGEGWRATPG